MLHHVLSEPLPQNRWMRDGGSTVAAFYSEFKLLGPGETPLNLDNKQLRNILSFWRSSYREPVVNRMIERAFARYIPPIIVLPGAVYIDFVRAYTYFKNLTSDAPDEGEQRHRRLELNRDEWERVVQKR